MSDIPLLNAMLCWNPGFKGAEPAFRVVPHPARGAARDLSHSVGACFSNWREMDEAQRKLQLMIDAWHIVAFYEVPVEMVREGLLVIPEYRDMLAGDCLPKAFQHERA